MSSAVVTWLAQGYLAQVMHDALRLFPAFEAMHFIGLCILFGSILIVDVRLLGFIRQLPLVAALKLIPIAMFGFLVSFISGFALFLTDPERYWASYAFVIKMALVVLGGVNALWFGLAERRKVLKLADDSDTAFETKFVAGLSLCLWATVLTLGRLLPYLDLEGG